MQIFTYFDASVLPKPELQGPVISHWYHSWKSHGWDPRMLTPRTWATDSKLARRVHDAVSTYEFEGVRIARLGACAAVISTLDATFGDSLFFVEYDVINFGLPASKRRPFDEYRPLVWEPHGLLNYWTPRAPIQKYGALGWEHAPLVRFSGPNKAAQIENCGREYC